VKTLDEDADDRDEREYIAFAITLLLYGQLLTYGLWVSWRSCCSAPSRSSDSRRGSTSAL